jgi:predicted N-acetyltransferase YhbS
MEIIQVDDVTPEQWEALRAGEADPFGADGMDLEWRRKNVHTVLRDGDRLIAHVGLLVVELEAGGRAFPAVGVGGVFVTRARRGQGLLRPLLDSALGRAAELGPAHAMLFCSDRNARMYERFGFRLIAAPVVVDQPGGPVEMPDNAMWRPLRDGASWPDGPVRVLGLPF